MSDSRPSERRKHPRVPAHTLAFLSAQLSGGAAVRLVDVSHRGVRLETTRHMRPGQTVCIRFSIDDRSVAVNAAVVRAAVTRLEPDAVRYETALALADECEQLQLALIERRRVNRADLTRTADGGAEPFPVAIAAERVPDTGYGWWLAERKRRTRRTVTSS